MGTYKCGFAAVNFGKHCWINGACVVCHVKIVRITVQMSPEPKPYDPKTYRLLSKDDMILYNPNLVSTRKRILSA